MTSRTTEVVVCGAGIAGIATAYHLTRQGVGDVVLVDERPPLSLTSDKSTECYRNLWPGPGDDMVAVMNRSIDLLEELARESGNVFPSTGEAISSLPRTRHASHASWRQHARRPRSAQVRCACTRRRRATTSRLPRRDSTRR